MSRSPLSKAVVSVGFVIMLASVWWLDRRAMPEHAPTDGVAVGFRFEETSKARGLDFTHRETTLDPKIDNIAPHVSAMGAAVSVVDFDNDGWSDLYVTSSRFGSPNALFRNEQGQFRDIAANAGLAQVNVEGQGVSMGSIWADFDNDGHADLFLYKWGWQQLFRNRGDGTFEDVSAQAGVRRWMNSNGACWLDYDRDGFVDLYVAGYFPERVNMWKLDSTRIMQESFEFARNGGHNVLWRNRGDGTFEDVTALTGCDSTRWTLAVAAADMDGDGFVDLYLANDYGPEELFRNVAGQRFELATGVGLEESSKSGMSVTMGDFENDGRLGVYVTNISKERYLFQGNNLRRNRLAERGRLFNIADTSSTSSRAIVDCGWAWGAQFGDLDNDGRLDLFVVNGFVSASRERDYWYGMSKVAGGAGNLFEDATLWEPMGDASLSGYEVSRVLHNQGNGRFRDVATSVGVRDEFDGRAVAFADFLNRGVLDAVVANQKGPLLFYENRIDEPRAWLQLKLRGRSSNTLAIGAQATVEFGGAKQVQTVQAGSGFCAQNDARLHFGLGDAQQVERVTIRWPNGASQELTGLALNRLHVIEEPAP